MAYQDFLMDSLGDEVIDVAGIACVVGQRHVVDPSVADLTSTDHLDTHILQEFEIFSVVLQEIIRFGKIVDLFLGKF